MIEKSIESIRNVVMDNPKNYPRILMSKENKSIVEWIDNENNNKYGKRILKTIQYDTLSIGQKIYCLLSCKCDIKKKCVICGKTFYNTKMNNQKRDLQTCSNECAHKLTFIKRDVNNMDKYGTKYPSQLESIKEKIRNTNIKKYGVPNPFQNEEVKEKIKKTNLEKYGVEYTFQSDVIKEKIKKVILEKYGCENAMQNHDVRIRNKSRYLYNEIHFDSAPEIAMYIYLTDHNIDFEYQPKIKIEYVCNNKSHFYFPDFRVNNELVEIKGNHFFKYGKMINPFDENKNDRYSAKYKCMIDNNVKILRENEYKKYLNYVYEKYGRQYLKQFKVKQS